MSTTKIELKYGVTIQVWPAGAGESVGIRIEESYDAAMAYLTPEQVDELIRALAAARVEISKSAARS